MIKSITRTAGNINGDAQTLYSRPYIKNRSDSSYYYLSVGIFEVACFRCRLVCVGEYCVRENSIFGGMEEEPYFDNSSLENWSGLKFQCPPPKFSKMCLPYNFNGLYIYSLIEARPYQSNYKNIELLFFLN